MRHERLAAPKVLTAEVAAATNRELRALVR
jgi:hypothetical protein